MTSELDDTAVGDRLLRPVLRQGVAPQRLSERLWTVMSAGDRGAPYDRKAALYDRLVESRAYNRALWSTSPVQYRAFARSAVDDAAGPLLEVGCGSASFSAGAYAAGGREVVLVDRSIAMLERAAVRLAAAYGEPGEYALLQADIDELPFEAAAFDTVLYMGGLHLREDVPATIAKLVALCAPGHLFVSSLVAETAVGKRYLKALHAAGEVAAPRNERTLRSRVGAGANRAPISWHREGSMIYAIL